jgi:hypothetical protein
MILGLQIISILFAFLMIYLAVLHRKRGEIDRTEIISWVTIWIVTIFVIIFPELLRTFARNFLITRLFDLMVIGGFILLIVMVSRAYIGTKRMERKIEEYVRKDALKEIKKRSRK